MQIDGVYFNSRLASVFNWRKIVTDYTSHLLDFMYVDKPKISSFLAQFLTEGLVVESSSSKAVDESKKINVSVTGKLASFLGMSVGASGGFEGGYADRSSETIKKNPEWAQAKALVQYVSDVQQQNQDCGGIGSLRILTGSLQIYDLTPFRQVADNSKLLSLISNLIMLAPEKFIPNISIIDQQIHNLEVSDFGKSRSRDISSERKKLLDAKKDCLGKSKIYIDAIVEGLSQFVRSSPFSIVAIFKSEGENYWFSLKQDFLLHDQGDTLLKYGYAVEGKWSIACIVDGDANSEELSQDCDDGIVWASLVRPVATVGRRAVGRPDNYRSLMPLAVFRSLGPILR